MPESADTIKAHGVNLILLTSRRWRGAWPIGGWLRKNSWSKYCWGDSLQWRTLKTVDNARKHNNQQHEASAIGLSVARRLDVWPWQRIATLDIRIWIYPSYLSHLELAPFFFRVIDCDRIIIIVIDCDRYCVIYHNLSLSHRSFFQEMRNIFVAKYVPYVTHVFRDSITLT